MADVEKILNEMTLDEKIAQMTSLWVINYVDNGKIDLTAMKRDMKDGIGEISRIAGTVDLEPFEIAQMVNEIQRFLVEETRLGIPALFHEECLSGFMTHRGTVFPQAINMACTWDPDIVKKVARIIGEQMESVGVNHGLAPLLDVARDARWGRVEETFGEDPYLVSIMGLNYIEGLQENGKIMATAKHFVGYSFSEGGRNIAPVHLGERELRDVFLLPFEIAVKRGKVLSVMNSYNEIDGVPVAGSRRLLRGILREEWKFDGLVISDYGSISMLNNVHRVAKDLKEASVISVKAGVDLELPHRECYSELLKEAVEEGLISVDEINEMVGRILRMKEKLGLFENPYVDPKNVPKYFDLPKFREAAREVALKSIVLLKNEDDLLPLKKDLKRIAVIGPSANSRRNLLGDYSYMAHLSRQKEGVEIVTILEGIKNKVSPGTEVLYAKGCDITRGDEEDMKQALNVAEKADVVILAVGGRSGLLGQDNTCGEWRDRTKLDLPGTQEELVRRIHEIGKPTVVILINGRPLGIEWMVRNIPAIIFAWLPGEEGGNAIADVIFGDYNPGGKLCITFPRNSGQEPLFYNHKPSVFMKGEDSYVDCEASPLFPFGHGLSYTKFEYSNLKVEPKILKDEDLLCVSFEIQNAGEFEGEEVVQLYVSDEYSSVVKPVKELKGFKRIHLKPHEKKKVVFRMPVELLAFHDMDMKRIIEPGKYRIMIGSSSEDLRLEADFEVAGEVRQIVDFERFETKVSIE